MTDVLVVGSVNIDLGLRVERHPSRGETVGSRSLTRRPGGKGANQAVAVCAAGATCALVSLVGADGAPLVEQLRASGVDTSRTRIDPSAITGMAVIMIDDDGQNSIIIAAGANGALGPDEVRAAVAAFPGSIVLMQGESPVSTIAAAAEATDERSLRFVLNLAPAIDVPRHVIEVADPLVVNEHEAAEVAAALGIQFRDVPEPDLAAALARVARSVVITLGADGAVWAEGPHSGMVTAEQVDVVDTTGAGDAFVGAMAAHLAGGNSLATAVRCGVDAGTRAVRTLGAREAGSVLW